MKVWNEPERLLYEAVRESVSKQQTENALLVTGQTSKYNSTTVNLHMKLHDMYRKGTQR